MKDLKLDSNWDLAYEAGDLVIIEDADVVEQSIKIALLTSYGEWLYDTEAGTAWIEKIMGKGRAPAAVEAEIRRVVSGVEGVQAVMSVEVTGPDANRNLTIAVLASTIYGDVEASLTV